MDFYINAIACISPQDTLFEGSMAEAGFLFDRERSTYVQVQEPAYTGLIPLNDQRRMSRLVRTGVYAALSCVDSREQHGIDGIIVGNGLGGLERAEVFLTSVLNNQERILSPTPFMQSLHSAIAGQIALELKCNGYTMTYAQGGFSFENALYDSMLLLREQEATHLLVGGMDEVTSDYIQIQDDLLRVKKDTTRPLEQSDTAGVMLGEGCTFLKLSAVENEHTLGRLCDVRQVYKPSDLPELSAQLLGFLSENNCELPEIDAVLMGNCGDPGLDETINALRHELFSDHVQVFFKNYCGEYPTASAFALWMAVALMHNRPLAERLCATASISRVLIVNHYKDTHYSFMLIAGPDKKS